MPPFPFPQFLMSLSSKTYNHLQFDWKSSIQRILFSSYRCGDNLAIFKYGYGLLPFHAILKLIPMDARFVYILTDSGAGPSNCHEIVERCAQYLRDRLPHTMDIRIVRGGNALVDFTRLMYANTTICSASTFCFFAGLANNGSNVHFPLTKLIAKPPDALYGEHFHWIPEPQVRSTYGE